MLKNVQVKFTNQEAEDLYNGILSPSSKFSAGIDLRITEDVTLNPNSVCLVGSGVSIFINNRHYCAKIFPRSGLGHKNGIVLGNLTGIIDADYQGEVKISLWNRGNEVCLLKKGDRVCQMIFEHVVHPNINVVKEFNDSTLRGDGGFGSSGKK